MTTETSPESAYPESKAVTGIQLDRLWNALVFFTNNQMLTEEKDI